MVSGVECSRTSKSTRTSSREHGDLLREEYERGRGEELLNLLLRERREASVEDDERAQLRWGVRREVECIVRTLQMVGEEGRGRGRGEGVWVFAIPRMRSALRWTAASEKSGWRDAIELLERWSSASRMRMLRHNDASDPSRIDTEETDVPLEPVLLLKLLHDCVLPATLRSAFPNSPTRVLQQDDP